MLLAPIAAQGDAQWRLTLSQLQQQLCLQPLPALHLSHQSLLALYWPDSADAQQSCWPVFRQCTAHDVPNTIGRTTAAHKCILKGSFTKCQLDNAAQEMTKHAIGSPLSVKDGLHACISSSSNTSKSALARISFLLNALCISSCFPASVMTACASVLSFCKSCASFSCLFKSLQCTGSSDIAFAMWTLAKCTCRVEGHKHKLQKVYMNFTNGNTKDVAYLMSISA